MMSTGVYVLLGMGGLALIFLTLSSLRGPRIAFLACCWLPLAGLAVTYVKRDQLSYGALPVLALIFITSAGLVGLGLELCIKARREKAKIGSLLAGTLAAGAPWLVLLALYLAQL